MASKISIPKFSFDKYVALLGNDASQTNAKEVEDHLRKSVPILQANETVELAYKCGRDSTVFTTKRLLLIDVQGMTGTKVEYLSVPYASVLAFAVETVGGWPDTDAELRLYTNMPGYGYIKKGFYKSKSDIFDVYAVLASKVLGGPGVERRPGSSGEGKTVAAAVQGGGNTAADFFHRIGNDMAQVDPKQVETHLRRSVPILQHDEHIELAFAVGRDVTVLTTKRMLMIDVKGWSGKRVAYLSLPYTAMRAFALRSAGGRFDVDAEVDIWTNIPALNQVHQDLRKGKADIFAIHKLLFEKLVAPQVPGPAEEGAPQPPPPTTAVEDAGNAAAFMAWLGGDATQISAADAESYLRASAPILQGDERVELAFKVGRDSMLLTSARILLIDVMGWSGKKVEWKTVPYSTVAAFSIQSAGGWDVDSELLLWTDIYPPPDTGDGPPPPGMTYIRQDLRKGKADIFAIQRVLAHKVLGPEARSRKSPEKLGGSPSHSPAAAALGGRSKSSFLDWDNASQLSPADMEASLRGAIPILLDDEHVELAYRARRDSLVLTTHRLMVIDVQGLSGKKISYESMGYKWIRAFAVQSASGSMLDRDTELKVWTGIPWRAVIEQDFKKEQADLYALHAWIAARVMRLSHHFDLPPKPHMGEGIDVPLQPSTVKNVRGWLGDDAAEIDPQEIEHRLRSNPPILHSAECVQLAFRVYRDMVVLTTYRLLVIDVQGVSGKKVEFRSVPYASLWAFAVETAGRMDLDAEMQLWTDAPGLSRIKQDFQKSRADVYAIQRQLAEKNLQV